MINGTLYYGASDSNFYARTFNGTSFGAQTPVNTHDLLVSLASWHTDVPNITSMFYDDSNGRLFYTLSGQTSLFYRGFTPENNVVAALRSTATTGVAGINFAQAAGAFLAGGKLYVADRVTGSLTRIDWANGAPVAGTATVVSSPALDGGDWRARGLFLYAPAGGAPPPNQPPVADIDVQCTGLACSFDGAGSSDPDGGIVSWAWNFGDGSTGSGATTSHTYAAGGTYQAQLTVTDNDGVTDSVTQQVTVSEPSTPVSFVGAAGSNGNSTSRQVTVPGGVTAGDGMLLFGTVAGATATMADPAGWTLVRTVVDTGVTTKLWQRVATAAEPGTVTVTLSALAKSDVTLLAYRGTAASGAVAAHAGIAETATTAAHVTPQLTVASPAWIVSYWADNSSATTAWTTPGGETLRRTACGTGGGRICALATDSGGPSPAGTHGGTSATASSASGKATMWTVALTD
jgi:PKD repeat protein